MDIPGACQGMVPEPPSRPGQGFHAAVSPSPMRFSPGAAREDAGHGKTASRRTCRMKPLVFWKTVPLLTAAVSPEGPARDRVLPVSKAADPASKELKAR